MNNYIHLRRLRQLGLPLKSDRRSGGSFISAILICLFSIILIWLGYFTPRQSFGQLFGLYSALFVVYFFLIKVITNSREVILVGFFFRLLLLFSIPVLSDDFYRFVWDGRLLINGLNPYTILPSEFVHLPNYQQVIHNSGIYQHLNSPNYYTVYPPLNQFIFAISAWLSHGSLFGNVVWLRVFILLAEFGTLFIMQKSFNQLKQNFNFYALNPLIIVELTGNLHFESVVMFFLLIALYFWKKNINLSIFLSAFFFACAVSTKMLPLIFIPLIIRQLGLKKSLLYTSIVGAFTLLFFAHFIDTLLVEKLFSSINLYFQKFEFNASIYYLVREIGFKIYGYNIIETAGKVMAFLTFSGIILISRKSKNFFIGALGVLTLYFAMATTIHPWYASTLVAVSIFTKFRYPIVWSYLIFLSYATYQTSLYQENLWLVALEYLVVLSVIIYEIKTTAQVNRE
jgi:alpha-1,6-mannosyltransferase